MFFSPIAAIVPASATAPALIVVGYLMMATLNKDEDMAERAEGKRRVLAAIDFTDISFGIPAVLTITIMPLTYSITNGIGAGFISFVAIKIAQGKARDVSWMLWVATGAFVLYFIFPLLRVEVRLVARAPATGSSCTRRDRGRAAAGGPPLLLSLPPPCLSSC